MLKTSSNGKNMIKEFEGFRANAYRCTSNKLTIGYGHTKGVKGTDAITREQGNILFEEDIKEFENAVNNLVKVPLNQNQFDALVSFCFNIGYGQDGFGGSTMRRLLNAGDYKGASEQFLRWVYSGGKVSLGLQRRREKEKQLFLS